MSSTAAPPRTSATGGQTQVQTPATNTPQLTTTPRQPVLHLRGATREEGAEGSTRSRPRIQWAEDVVDNEGLGRKKSKVCCIYHAPKGIDESSDESSSDSSSDESDSGDDGAARPSKGRGERHTHGHGHDHDHNHGSGGKGKGRASSPNAYEKVPKVKAKAKE
ncbi:Type 1 phosphatases regulator [Lachnellula suecica]|uniref:Type 1 phosphatases regulator n=1 Tax=Lachnellula suecica TaxID=602035 RepID=A0A8T9CE53_9HELO|nr:Type 1 phosphatases regulator [Lachnellula suecica]